MAIEPQAVDRTYYPDSDGKPLGETGWHIRTILEVYFALQQFFRGRGDVLVASNLLLYYERGNRRAVVVPDVFVVFGVPSGLRRIYKLWEEGQPPWFVLEVTSRRTRKKDQGDKLALYARLGVREVVLFDPLGEYLRPRLLPYRLGASGFEPDAPVYLADGELGWRSEVLGLDLHTDGTRLRLWDPRARAYLAMPDELALAVALEERQRRQAEQRAERAEQRIAALEQELARLRAELEQRRGE